MKIKPIHLIIVISLFCLTGAFVLLSRSSGPIRPGSFPKTLSPTAKPDPYDTLTIPSLRARTYKSQIGERSVYLENDSYSSYLTSYDSDGLKINALLTIPNGKEPDGGWPAIVFVHGYIPPTLYRTTEKYVAYVDYLARNGFMVFKIDLRGHGDSEGTPGGGYYSSDYVIDTLNAYAALTEAPFVNKEKIGIWGHSMAGNVVLRAAVANQHVPAIVIWAGAGYTYQDLRDYRINDTSYQRPSSESGQQRLRNRLFDVHGQFDPDDAFWKRVVPTNYLNGYFGAIELIHAADDPVVSIEYSRNLNQILDKTNIQHEFHEYPTGGHNIEEPSFTPAMEQTVRFFKTHMAK